MASVLDILDYVNSIAPDYMAEPWDNCGLLCGRQDKEVRKILVALDPFQGVIQEAIDLEADLILTHHPLIFGDALMAVTDASQTGRNLLTLIQHDIAAINAHTNLDQAPGGVNDVLAAKLGLENIRILAPKGTDGQGRPWGLLRAGQVPAQSLSDFMSTIKKNLGAKALRYVNSGKPVHLMAVGGGACGDELMTAVEAGCDTFVTSDVKYNQFWDAHDLGLNLIDACHFYTENPVTEYLARQLQAAFPQLTVLISQTHRDIMEFF